MPCAVGTYCFLQTHTLVVTLPCYFTDICIAQSLSISRDSTDEDFDDIVVKLTGNDQAKAVVMFVNEDNSKRLLQALMRSNHSETLWFLASDSWGAKVHPVFGQEVAAVDAVTILPKRRVIKGMARAHHVLSDELRKTMYWVDIQNNTKYKHIYIKKQKG